MVEEKIILEVKNFANKKGLKDVNPIILSTAANLIIHLSPYNIVARIALYDSNSESVRVAMQKEVDVASHLHASGVSVITPNHLNDDGPYNLEGHWMTLWNLEEKGDREGLTAVQAIQYVDKLTQEMKKYKGNLPVLGVWKRVHISAINLSNSDDPQILNLIERYSYIDKKINNIEKDLLIPSHGDSHAKNLYPGKSDWVWMDFEDASLMPEYWDMTSFLANIALFNGLETKIVQKVIENKEIVKNKEAFLLVLQARILMSIIGNLDMAHQGLGDMEYVTEQLEKYEILLSDIEEYKNQLL